MADYSDPDAEKLLREIAVTSGFSSWLKLELVAAGNGQCELLLNARPEMKQHHGFVHGGIIATLADNSCSWAAATAVGDVVTSGFTIQYLSPARTDRVRAKASVIKAGKRIVSVEARLWAEAEDTDPKLIATALASIAALGERAKADA